MMTNEFILNPDKLDINIVCEEIISISKKGNDIHSIRANPDTYVMLMKWYYYNAVPGTIPNTILNVPFQLDRDLPVKCVIVAQELKNFTNPELLE